MGGKAKQGSVDVYDSSKEAACPQAGSLHGPPRRGDLRGYSHSPGA